MSVILIEPKKFIDERGWFAQTYSTRAFRSLGIADTFIQDNHSYSAKSGTLRGLHFQNPPYAQAKLLCCVRGSIQDVVVDIRVGSPTFGQWVSLVINATQGNHIYIPTGFAHGFVTLEADTVVIYKVSNYYMPESEGGIIWNDLDAKIDWALSGNAPSISPRDAKLHSLAKLQSPFSYVDKPLAITKVSL
jgi:dTDP-4-dehydrorhamnose 3,5-epimerase